MRLNSLIQFAAQVSSYRAAAGAPRGAACLGQGQQLALS